MITNSEFNQKLIIAINYYIPEKNKQLDLLLDLFYLGKEAAYRRLRGDVPFSFTEACIISNHLGISLDNIVGMSAKEHSIMYELVTPSAEVKSIEELSSYYHNLIYNEYLSAFEKYVDRPNLDIMSANNMIPHSLLLPYKYLSRFNAFKWIYQFQRGMSCTFAEVDMKPEMSSRLKDLGSKLSENSEFTFIFGRYIFITFIKQILHFRRLQLILDEDIVVMKDELLDLISKLEQKAIEGINPGDKRVWIYLSNVEFECNYTYLKCMGEERTFMHIFQIHTLSSADLQVCQMTRDWIESLKKYSTLISVSGEMERSLFFEEQRKYLEKLIA